MANISPSCDIQAFTDLDGTVQISKSDPFEETYTVFWKVFDSGDVYFARVPKKRANTTFEDVKSSLRRIPNEEIYPKVNTNVKMVGTTGIIGDELYVKRPSLPWYGEPDENTWIRNIFLAEALILERISQTPHENIVQYYGCYLRDGRLMGIALQRYRQTLLEHLDMFMGKLISAINHLHSIGLAHNDLKPANVMLTADNMPVIIDFGSCQPFGARLMQGGTPGWCEEPVHTSEGKHDIYALKLIREWLANPDRGLSG
jgi:serine/threonine protein kinase